MTSGPARPSGEFLTFQKALAGRYSIERELGRGGMGIVFLAREVALDRMVALKLLPPDLAARPGLRERFLREARTAARLSHPNIVPIHTVDEADGFVFFAMAYVPGESLGERIRTRGPLSNSDAARVLREVAWALAHAQLHGVVHRDVKPDNILLEEGSGRALVADFGIAALVEAANPEGGELLGTAEFMSPEQAAGGEVDARSDLYSLGCVGFYALSGQVPFTGPTPAAILAQHVTRPPPPLLSVAPQVQAHIAAAIDRCLRKEPERRFSGADALAEALGPEGQIERELPVSLRVFIKQNRELETAVAWCLLGLLFAVPAMVTMLLSEGPTAAGVLILDAVVATLLGIPVVRLLRDVRRLLKSGFTLEDAGAAWAQDVKLRDEEFRFEVGKRETFVDRVLRLLKWTGYAVAAVSLPTVLAAGGWIHTWVDNVFSWSLLTGLGASVVDEIRARARSDVMGERWLRVWDGWVGKRIFKVAGLGLKRVVRAISGAHRPTEVALGLAADRLFEQLPKEIRKTLKALPETVKSLEEDARAMRAQVAELNAILAEIGDDDPSRPGAAERARVRAGVEATRDAARDKLQQAVKALEAIRLGLLLMHGGGGTVESLTLDLEAAREVAADMANLLEGHREVARLLRERRETGTFALSPGEEESGSADGR
ncbi:MAG: serine/threonine protein kinase [Gemmatimonadetes bacterium]|nr:serine/threonine protein kinase [Gemmatimonadota bacterium]